MNRPDWDPREVVDWVFQHGDEVVSDVLFVFGTPHHIPEFADRIRRLYVELALRCIIISGHNGEAEALANAAVQRGVPPKILRLENTAANTLENVLCSEALLRTACLDG